MRLTNTCRSTGKFRVRDWRPRRNHIWNRCSPNPRTNRAMPPRPLVSNTIAAGGGLASTGGNARRAPPRSARCPHPFRRQRRYARCPVPRPRRPRPAAAQNRPRNRPALRWLRRASGCPPQCQGGAKTARVVQQQPMAGRHRGDAADVNQTPFRHLRKLSSGRIQRAAQIRPRFGAVKIRKRSARKSRGLKWTRRPGRANRTARFPPATRPCSSAAMAQADWARARR